MEESRQAKVQEESGSSDAAFLGYKKKWNQNWKGKRTQKEKKTTAFPFKCHRCGVVGHKKYECPRTQKSGEKTSIAENDENSITFSTACGSSLISTEHNSEIIKFMIDSEATNHPVTRTTGNFLEETEFVLYEINVAKFVDYEVRKLEESGFQIIFNNNEVAIRKNGALILKGKLQGNLYVISLELLEDGYNTAGTATNDMLMHRKMGHSSHFMGHSSHFPAPTICEVCLQGKQTRLPFRSISGERKAKRILEVVSSDVCGPMNPPTYDGKRYYSNFQHNNTRRVSILGSILEICEIVNFPVSFQTNFYLVMK
ncbi:hypothetical protein JTB14_016578 [Gonioctena quinquepunctata]|nr:hypothetical protein JTB14_016578 [Gonioctena quinquepunctata]